MVELRNGIAAFNADWHDAGATGLHGVERVNMKAKIGNLTRPEVAEQVTSWADGQQR